MPGVRERDRDHTGRQKNNRPKGFPLRPVDHPVVAQLLRQALRGAAPIAAATSLYERRFS